MAKWFEKGFWYMAFDCLFSYSIGFSSIVLGSNEYIERFGYAPFKSGQIITFPYLIAAICTPIIGKISDKYGYRMFV